jgi:hypothetical protein
MQIQLERSRLKRNQRDYLVKKRTSIRGAMPLMKTICRPITTGTGNTL